MPDKFQHKYRIPSTRATFHNYDSGAYFVTICTGGMNHFFGEISNDKMVYTEIGAFAARQVEETMKLRKNNVEIPVYTVMPNHIHLIVIINECHRRDAPRASKNTQKYQNTHTSQNKNTDTVDKQNILDVDEDARGASLRDGENKFGPQKNNLASVIRGIKSAVKSYANQNNIPFSWQSRFYDRIIRDQNEMNRIAEYIENNPYNWATDKYNQL